MSFRAAINKNLRHIIMVGLRKSKDFKGKTRKAAESTNSIGRRKEKEEEEEGKSWKFCIFGSRVPPTASRASKPSPNPKMIKQIISQMTY